MIHDNHDILTCQGLFRVRAAAGVLPRGRHLRAQADDGAERPQQGVRVRQVHKCPGESSVELLLLI